MSSDQNNGQGIGQVFASDFGQDGQGTVRRNVGPNIGVQGPMMAYQSSSPYLTSTASIPKLNGKNYLTWKTAVEIVLRLRRVDRAVDHQVENDVEDSARVVLIETMDEAHNAQMSSEPSVRAIMKELERQYAKKSAATKYRLLSEFIKYQKKSSDSINQHVAKLKEMRAALANLKEVLSEDFFLVCIINSLGNEFGDIMDQWDRLHDSQRDFEFLLNMLEQKEKNIQEIKPEKSVFFTNKDSRPWDDCTIEERKRRSSCKKCGQKGHWFKECTNPPLPELNWREHVRKQGEPSTSKNKGYTAHVTFNLGKLGPNLKDKWVLDSGASNHMCNNKNWFSELKIYATPTTTTVGSGEQIAILGYGTLKIVSLVGAEKIEVTLKNVCYIPELVTNLVSVGVASAAGLSTVFEGDKCQILNGKTALAEGNRNEEDLYVLNWTCVPETHTLLTQATRTIDEWHKVLGHPDERKLTKLMEDGTLGIKATGSLDKCAECCEGKATHVQHPSRVGEKATEVGQKVHMDLGFISNKEKASYDYYLLCKDEVSEFTMIYFIDSKTQVKQAIEKLVVDFEVGSGKSIRGICSDNGTEFCNRATELLFLKERIQHETSSPYISQQNGIIERAMRTINNTARTLLCEAKMNTSTASAKELTALYREALRTACYLRNRVPTSKSPLTPYERFIGRKPNLKNLVKFGEKVQILDNVHTLAKFEPRTKNGFVVGFTSRYNTYRVFVPDYGRTIETCDVYLVGHSDNSESRDTNKNRDREKSVAAIPLRVRLAATSERNMNANENTLDPSRNAVSQEIADEVPVSTEHEDAGVEVMLGSTPKIGKNGRPYVSSAGLQGFFAEQLRLTKLATYQEELRIAKLAYEQQSRLAILAGDEEQMRLAKLTYYEQVRQAREEYENQMRSANLVDSSQGETNNLPSGSNPAENSELVQRQSEPADRNRTFEACRDNTETNQNENSPGHTFDIGIQVAAVNPEDTSDVGRNHTFEVDAQMLDLDIPEICPPPPPPRMSSSFLMSVTPDEPKTFKQAVSGPNSNCWKDAIAEELTAHQENGTWVVVDKPKRGTTLTARWVFAIKRKVNGDIERFKARLVARGFQQKLGIDYYETYSPVAKLDSIRLLLAMAAVMAFNIIQFDIATAFLNGEIEEQIFMDAPVGVNIADNKCLKLVKALYGLKQAPLAWHKMFDKTLVDLGFKATIKDCCVYVNKNASAYILIYVDDGLIVGADREECEQIYSSLKDKFRMKRLAGEMFVGLQIERTDKSIQISQSRYVNDILNKFNMEEANGARSPFIDAEHVINVENSPQTSAPYREAIGSLMYLANATRPDIVFAVHYLSRFNDSPTEAHWTAVKQVMRYLKHTAEYGIEYSLGNKTLECFSDADYGSKKNKRRSMSGVLIKFGGGPIIFSSRKQEVVSHSSTESEYYAADEAVRDIAWVSALLKELSFHIETPFLYIDNKSTIKKIINRDNSRKSKHIDIRYEYIRQEFKKGLFKVEYIPTLLQPADGLTKPLTPRRLEDMVEKTRIVVRMDSPRVGTIAKMALICICGMALINMADGFYFEKADPLHFNVLDKHVQLGTGLYNIRYMPVAPCSLNTSDWNSMHDIKKISYESLQEECRLRWSRNIDPLLDAFTKWSEQKSRRPKRFLDPFTLGLVVFGIVALVGWLGQMAYSYWSGDSSYNRLNKMEEQVEKKNEEFEDEIKGLKKDLLNAHTIRTETINLIDRNEKNIAKNTQAIGQMAKLMPSISMTANDMFFDMDRQEKMLKRMVAARKNNQASPDDYAELFKIDAIKGLKPKDTHVSEARMRSSGLIEIELYYVVMSPDTAIYQVMPLRHYRNVTVYPTLVQYGGPKWVMYNETSNCLRGVEDPNTEPTYTHCRDTDYRDPNLSKWVDINRDHPDFVALSQPHVFKTHTETIISCLFHDIVIDNVTVACPHFPFRLPLKTRYTLPNQEHDLRIEIISSSETKVQYQTPHFANHGGSESSELVKRIRDLNDASLTKGRFGIEKSTLTIPLDRDSLFSIIGAVSGLITIFWFVWWICSGRKTENGNASEHINVINAQPIAPATPAMMQPSRMVAACQVPTYIPLQFRAQYTSGDQARPGLPMKVGNSSIKTFCTYDTVASD